MSKLLLDSKPLLIITELAELIGLNEAIFIQQLHYWLEINKDPSNHSKITMWEKHKQDEMWWVWNTVEDWKKKDFPFWGTRTIERIIKKLKDQNLILVRRYNLKKYDKTNWYTINYNELRKIEDKSTKLKEEKLMEEVKRRIKKEKSVHGINTHTDNVAERETRMNTHTDKMADGKRQNGGMHTDNVAEPIPEITAEITSEISTTTAKQEIPKAETPKNVVVVEDSVIDNLFQEIKIKIKSSVSKAKIRELITNFGFERVKKYLDNWDKFNHYTKKTVSGFFISAVQFGYEIPSVQLGTSACDIPQHTNFDQRDIPDDGYEQYFYKIPE